jgi:hypothetical protein
MTTAEQSLFFDASISTVDVWPPDVPELLLHAAANKQIAAKQ